jgi:aspartyl-tRNA(Asn)/glutamyl-tRNA(Gln) amidotransferase subunit A
MWSVLKGKGVLLGAKLAMDEFAMGSFSNTSSFGKVSVPGFKEHSAGGSSGGSGAALAADLVDFTTGSDTGGSVRLPASFCSVVGYKPTYGAFSRYGMIAYASSLDQAGLLSKSLEDLKYLLSAEIANKDKKDMTSVGLGMPKFSTMKKDWKVGYFEEFLTEDTIQMEVKQAYIKTLEQLKVAGATLIPMQIKYMKEAAQIYYIIACSEASSNLARYQGVFFGEKLIDKDRIGNYWEQIAEYRSEFFGLEVQKRIMLGSFILSAENFSAMYQKAVTLRLALIREFEDAFTKVDKLVLPVSPMTSPTWDNISKMTTAQIYMSDYMTVPFSLAGLPAISLPWFKTKEGLGIGMQFVGKKFEDYELVETMLEVEARLKKCTEII